LLLLSLPLPLLLLRLLLLLLRQLTRCLGFFSSQLFREWWRNMPLLLFHGIHWMPASGTRRNVSCMD
jgi:hypothetical protein